ncbi:MAG: hypothetical protein IT175_15335 [Acidobacteria bacterium]|nr:hypothetical protein [Acidobacteriota bacterium]
MIRRKAVAAMLIAAFSALQIANAQEAVKPSGLLGDLAAIDAANGVLSIKSSAGAIQKAVLTKSTDFLLVEPGKKSLEGAEKVTLADLKVGDRVWARGATNADGSVTTRQVLVMNAEAIAQRNARDAEDWQKRGVIGEVKAVDTTGRTLRVESYRGESLTVAISDATVLRRLKDGSTDLANSDAINLADVVAGNQIATRGERDPATGRVDAVTVLTGTFPRPVRGRVTAVDSAALALTVETREGPVQLSASKESLFRRLDVTPPTAAPAAPAADGAQRRGPGGFAFALGDRAELDKRTKPIQIGDVAVGDFCFVVVEPGATASAAAVRILVKLALPRNGQSGQSGQSGPTWPSDFGGSGLPF